MRKVLQALVSGLVVYVTVAACSSGSDDQQVSRVPGVRVADSSGGAQGSAGRDSVSSTGGSSGQVADADVQDDGGVLDSLIDVLTDPVPEAMADVATSGSRLKARWYVGADGSRQFKEWWDSKTLRTCEFSLAEDAVLRCLPKGDMNFAGYSDAECTQPVTAKPIDTATTTVCDKLKPRIYATQSSKLEDGCTPNTVMYQIGTTAMSFDKLYLLGNDGTCWDGTLTGDYSNHVFYKLEKIDPSEFVPATIEES